MTFRLEKIKGSTQHNHMKNPKNMTVMLSALSQLGVNVKECMAEDLYEVVDAFEHFIDEVSKIKK